MKKRILTAALALCLLLTLLPTAAMAASNEISTFSDLEAAFSNGGTYTLTQDITVTRQLTLDSGKTLTINGGEHILAPEVTGLNAQGIVNDDASAINNIIKNNGTLTLSSLTIYGGKGRCVYNGRSGELTMNSVSLERAHLTGSSTDSTFGAGLYNQGNALMVNGNIRRNGCDAAGGGFLNSGTFIVENCSIVENRNFGSGTGGGAGENSGKIYMNNCTVANNQSSEIGGAINNYGGELYIMNSTFSGNVTTSTFYGGGAIGNHSSSAKVYAVNSVFAFNYADGSADDIGESGRNVYLYNCAYGTILSSITTSDCKTLTGTPADAFNGSRTSGIVSKEGIESTTQIFARPLITRTGNFYGVYPKFGSTLLSGGVDTYYDRTGFTVYMAYGSTPAALGSLTAASTKVTTYQNGAARAVGVIGALPASAEGKTYYTVTVKPAEGGSVTGDGSALGESFESGSSISITAVPDANYTFTGWLVGEETTPSSTENPYAVASLNSDISLTPVFTASPVSPVYYNVTVSVNNSSYGSAAADPSSTTSGNTVTLTATANTGYEFTGWDVIGGGVTLADASSATTTFTMGDSAVSVKANFAPLPTPTHTVSFESNGGSAVDAETVEHGSTAAEPADPIRRGHSFRGWYADADFTAAYDFATPVTGDITLYAKWQENPPTATTTHTCESKCEICGGCEDAACEKQPCEDKCLLLSMNFTDVDEDAYYAEAVEYVYHRGMMQGKTAAVFNVSGSVTRGQIVTILWRLEGSPAVTGGESFSDVVSGKYYAEAVQWAAANGIASGYNDGTFRPDQAISRQQLATFLFRYAQHKGYDVSVGEDTNILSYEDVASVSEYAIPAMQWACGAGLIQGSNGNLLPGNTATRAQAAAILMRFCVNVAKI